MSRSLYISYFGVNEPLVQTQVIPYLRELVKGGHELTLLTFEPDETDEKSAREKLAEDGIDWHWLRYHKRPSVPATLFDIANAVRFIRRLMNRQPFDILHARSHVPMMMAALARKASRHKPKLLFDIRGFMPEEYVDAGVWPEGGAIYRTFKRIEIWLMKEAGGFVMLTEKAKDLLAERIGSRPAEVIPCCVDFEKRFSRDAATERTRIRKKLGIEDRFVFAHVGALGGLYLADEIADFLQQAKASNEETFGLFLSQSNPNMIVPLLRSRGFDDSDFFIAKVPPSDVESYLYASDVGLSFVKATFATQSRSPTKIPEYLAAGIPVVANAGVGDVDQQIGSENLGLIVEIGEGLSEHELSKLNSARGERLKHAAVRLFDLTTIGGTRYRRIYAALAQDSLE